MKIAMIEYLVSAREALLKALYDNDSFDECFDTCSDALRYGEPFDIYIIFGDRDQYSAYGAIGWCVDIMRAYPQSRFIFFTPDPQGSHPRQDLVDEYHVQFEHVHWDGNSLPNLRRLGL